MKFIIDTDLNFPSDDFEALIIMLHRPDAEILGCCSAAGNTWSEEVYCNLKHALTLLRREDIPVLAGPPAELFRPWMGWARSLKSRRGRSFIGAYEKSDWPRHWITGLRDRLNWSAPEFIVRQVRLYPNMVSVICIGPVTNLARALELDSTLAEALGPVLVMGGHFQPDGSPGCIPDFNVLFDPEAMERVLVSCLNVLLLPLDVCKSAAVSPDLVSTVCKYERGAAGVFSDDFFGMVRQHGPRMPLWDQLLALIAFDPDLVTESRRGWVRVSTDSDDGRGQTFFEPDVCGNVRVVRAVDPAAVRRGLLAALSELQNTDCQHTGPFGTPRFIYFAQQALENFAPSFIESSWGTTAPEVMEIVEIGQAVEFARRAGPLSRLWQRAKEGGAVWPPAPITYPSIRACPKAVCSAFDPEERLEMQHRIFDTFIAAAVVAYAKGPGGREVGFVSLSNSTGLLRRELEEWFTVQLAPTDLIMESAVEDGPGPDLLAYLISNVFEWCRRHYSSAGDSAFYVVPAGAELSHLRRFAPAVIGRGESQLELLKFDLGPFAQD